jgi:hypothetical protein
MTVLKGHYDGQRVVLDEPVPAGVNVDTPVKVVFETEDAGAVLANIAQLGCPGGLPADFAQQHEHYVKGTPRQ